MCFDVFKTSWPWDHGIIRVLPMAPHGSWGVQPWNLPGRSFPIRCCSPGPMGRTSEAQPWWGMVSLLSKSLYSIVITNSYSNYRNNSLLYLSSIVKCCPLQCCAHIGSIDKWLIACAPSILGTAALLDSTDHSSGKGWNHLNYCDILWHLWMERTWDQYDGVMVSLWGRGPWGPLTNHIVAS